MEEEIVIKDINVEEAKNKNLTEQNNILTDRQPKAYKKLTISSDR